MDETNACTIRLESQPMDCSISQSAPLVATGLVTGKLAVHSYKINLDNPAEELLSSCHAFTVDVDDSSGDVSCRAVSFLGDGNRILCGTSTGTLCVIDAARAGSVIKSLPACHADAVSRVVTLCGGLAASGDEAGAVKVWDARCQKQVMSYKKHTDFISDFAMHEREMRLVVTSGDSTLSVHDVRAGRSVARSETDNDDELLSCAVMKRGKKVVVGTQSGVLNLYSWGHFNDCSDRFPGHPESIDALMPYDDDTLLSGSSDGVIRIVNVLPNRLLGVLGGHEDLPVEHMSMSADKRVLATTSHDDVVRLWDLSVLIEGPSDGNDKSDGDSDDDDSDYGEDPKPVGSTQTAKVAAGVSHDDDDDGDGSDVDDNEDEGDEQEENEEEEGLDDGDDDEEEKDDEDEDEDDGNDLTDSSDKGITSQDETRIAASRSSGKSADAAPVTNSASASDGSGDDYDEAEGSSDQDDAANERRRGSGVEAGTRPSGPRRGPTGRTVTHKGSVGDVLIGDQADGTTGRSAVQSVALGGKRPSKKSEEVCEQEKGKSIETLSKKGGKAERDDGVARVLEDPTLRRKMTTADISAKANRPIGKVLGGKLTASKAVPDVGKDLDSSSDEDVHRQVKRKQSLKDSKLGKKTKATKAAPNFFSGLL